MSAVSDTPVLTRLPSLTGLRFLAAFGVFGYHVLALIPAPALVRPLLLSGQSGVSFFFVLSGFVLTWSSGAASSAARVRPGAFWQRRVARIVPSHVVTWAIGIPVSALRFGAFPHLIPLLATLGLAQSWIAEQSVYFGVNGVAWSLSCEAFFYALFPALILLVRRMDRRHCRHALIGCTLILAAVQLVGWAVAGSAISDSARPAFWLVSVLPVSRLPEFVFGMVLARLLQLGARPPVGLVPAGVIVGIAAYLAGLAPTAVVAGWLTVLPFGLLIAAAADRDCRGRSSWLARGWAVRLGEWSFAFYLCHQLVLRLVDRPWPDGQGWAGQVATDLVLALLASAALHRFVEVPWERRLRPRRRVAAVVPGQAEAEPAATDGGVAWTVVESTVPR